MFRTFIVFLLFLHHGRAGKEDHFKISSASSRQSGEIIAFSAELSKREELLPESIVRFDKVLANEGGWYFNTSGQFGCPDDGLYVFMWNTLKSAAEDLDGMRCILKLQKAATDVKYGPKTDYYTAQTDSGVHQMTAVVQCSSTFTAITVVTAPWDANQMARYAPLYTTFSGYKLYSSVAFTVELSQDLYAFPRGRIWFDRILSNHGEHYDPLHGYFRCPDDGIYVFTLSVQTPDHENPWSVSRLVMDGAVVMRGPITYRATEAHDSGSASSTIVLQCNESATIYAEAQNSHDFPYNSYGAELTAFTGFKLYDADVPGVVAFTAVITTNKTVAQDGEPIPFDATLTNIGDAFSITQNRFLCPDNDFYLFTWTVVSNKGGSTVNLHMDGVEIKRMVTTGETSGDATTGSSTVSVVQKCSQGSFLQVIVSSGSTDRDYLGEFVFFSGYKVPGDWAK